MIPGLLPDKTPWVIAGGFAACPALAADIDVWVIRVDTEDLQLERAELLVHLAKHHFDVSTEAGDNVSNPDYADFGGEDRQISILKVGRVKGRDGGLDVHLMVTDAFSVDELLNHFDISTHAVAFTSDGRIYKHKKWTPPSVPPVELKSHTTSASRMQKIAARFGHADVSLDDIPF